MSMGINPASEVFQRRLTQVLEGLPEVKITADDIFIIGEENYDAKGEQYHGRKLQGCL